MNELCPRRAAANRYSRTGQSLCVRFGCAIALLGLLGSACGSGHHRPPPPAESNLQTPDLTDYDSTTADARDVFANGECENGATQTCRIYLASHDGIQPCFVGMQACVETHWSICDDAVLVDANADDAALDPAP
jgi:hypothetical protein